MKIVEMHMWKRCQVLLNEKNQTGLMLLYLMKEESKSTLMIIYVLKKVDTDWNFNEVNKNNNTKCRFEIAPKLRPAEKLHGIVAGELAHMKFEYNLVSVNVAARQGFVNDLLKLAIWQGDEKL